MTFVDGRVAQTVDARPAVVNLLLYRGDDFRLDLVVTDADGGPADLTGVTASAQIRKSVDDPAIVSTFDATVDVDTIHLHLAHDEASVLVDSIWDCQIEDTGGTVATLVAGTVSTSGEVTR